MALLEHLGARVDHIGEQLLEARDRVERELERVADLVLRAEEDRQVVALRDDPGLVRAGPQRLRGAAQSGVVWSDLM